MSKGTFRNKNCQKHSFHFVQNTLINFGILINFIGVSKIEQERDITKKHLPASPQQFFSITELF